MKTNDPLDDFIRSNREGFDDREVPRESWKHISDTLGLTKKTTWWNNVVIWRAAAVLFMAVSVYLAVPVVRNNAVAENGKATLNEFKDVETFYTGEISRKVALIDELSNGSDEDTFSQDMKQLEAMYSVLKEELRVRPSKKVKDALELNLLIRINLLNQQLQRLEDEDRPAGLKES